MIRRKILIIDDEPDIRENLARFFERNGYLVTAVENGFLALSLIRSYNFDAVVSDINMPDIGGLEFAKRAVELYPDLVIIFLTGYGSLETAQEAIRLGAHDYFTKPTDSAVIMQSLENKLSLVEEKKKSLEYLLKLQKDAQDSKDKLDSLKNEFMILISHELKTPCSVISDGIGIFLETIGFLGQDKLDRMNDEQRARIMKGIESSRRRLVGTIDNITYYMELSKGSVKLNKSNVILSDFLEENFSSIERMVFECGAKIEKDFDNGCQQISIDKEKILDVLARLIQNAASYSQKIPEIIVKLHSISKVESGVEKKYFIIEVCDNGDGIEKKVMENIFNPFNVGDIKHHSRGLGLGLAICRKVIQLHEGSIGVDSALGKGTVVHIEIPQGG